MNNKKFRRVYLDVISGNYHAKYIGEQINSILLHDTFPADILVIPHNKETTGVIVEAYDEEKRKIYLNEVIIVDENTIEIINTHSFTGYIKIIFFEVKNSEEDASEPVALLSTQPVNKVKLFATEEKAKEDPEPIEEVMPMNTTDSFKKFITTWKTDNDGGSKTKIVIPLQPNFDYDFEVDWGDGDIEHFKSDNIELIDHIYEEPGIYDVSIRGKFPTLIFSNTYPKNISRNKLIDIKQWGDIIWETMVESFTGCENLKISATDIPNLTEAHGQFFTGTFKECRSLTEIPNLDSWDISNCTSLKETFKGCRKFNSNINSWDVSKVKNFDSTFEDAREFNQDLSSWKTLAAKSFRRTFFRAKSFDQNIGHFNLSKVINIDGFLDVSNISVENYTKTLNGWKSQKLMPNLSLGVLGIKYDSEGKVNRSHIIKKHRWEFIGDEFIE